MNEWKDKIDSEMNQDMKRKIVALKKTLKEQVHVKNVMK